MPNGAKHWCFTINNPTTAESNGDWLGPIYSYAILANETGADGTPHVQGYICFNSKKTLGACKILCIRAHWEVMRGTPQQASDYCKKDGDYIECGTLPLSQGVAGGQASAARFKRNIDLAKEGKLSELIEIDPASAVQHYHSYKRIMQDFPKVPKDLDNTCGQWIYGETGIGKSRKARLDNTDIFDKPCNKWWDGYQGEKTVLIDDFDKFHKVLGHYLKRWADRYSFPAEQKGTTTQIRPEKIVVTSNYSIEEIFFEDEALVKALKRRFVEIHMVQPFPAVVAPDQYDSNIDTDHSSNDSNDDEPIIID